MARKRPKGVLEITWAVAESAVAGRKEHVPVADDYPDTVVRRTTFTAGGGLGWKLSAIESPRARAAPWKIVVVTGAPIGTISKVTKGETAAETTVTLSADGKTAKLPASSLSLSGGNLVSTQTKASIWGQK